MRGARLQDRITHPLSSRTHHRPKRLGPGDKALRAVHIMDPVSRACGLVHNASLDIKRPQHARHLDEQLAARDETARSDSAAEPEACMR